MKCDQCKSEMEAPLFVYVNEKGQFNYCSEACYIASGNLKTEE